MKFFCLSFLLLLICSYAGAQVKINAHTRDSLEREINNLQSLAVRLADRIDKLKESFAVKDSMLRKDSASMIEITKVSNENKELIRDLESTKSNSAEDDKKRKEIIRELKSLGREHDKVIKEYEILKTDHQETKELIADAELLAERLNKQIMDARQSLKK